MYFLLNLNHCVKSYEHFCLILAFFTMPAHHIWSFHVTQDTNFDFLYFVLILHLILGKVTKFLVKKLSTSDVISQKTSQGWKTPSSLPVLGGGGGVNPSSCEISGFPSTFNN